MYSHSRISRRAFTLVELLVVVLIISILLTVGAGVFRGAGGKGVTTATATMESLFDEARTIALSKRTRTRVLINVDEVDREDADSDYLRRVLIAYEETDEETGEPIEDSWKLIGRGYTFPPQVFFSQVLSELNESNLEDSPPITLDVDSGLYTDRSYLYYEFNSEGICANGMGSDAADYTGPSFVLGSGIRKPGQEPQIVGSEAKRDFGGFVIWRSGSTSAFREPTQISGINELQGNNF